MSDAAIEDILDRIETAVEHEFQHSVEKRTDNYDRAWAGAVIELTHQAIKDQNYARAHELLDDLRFTFVGSRPDSESSAPRAR